MPALKVFTWKQDRTWNTLYCGEKQIGYAKISDSVIKPYVWLNYLTSNRGSCDTLEEAKFKLEDDFKKLVADLINF